MKIYSMTATFGKLENQTLTLQPGLNIISAPNEWGKTTWCTFLATMLYGLDTREKTTKTALAVKERYAPWSGSPMSGRIDLNWNGRDITIERWTKGRTPLGEFRAYETASGLEIPELTGANCGEMLLGVERSVFLRAGFLRLSDLPVTQDESLRRRLNALVTTGDESNAGDLLAQKLKDLKNKCRYNRSGVLPQAEAEQAELHGRLTELSALQIQAEKLKEQQTATENRLRALENHQSALRFEAAQADLVRVEQAHIAAEAAAEAMAKLEEACACPISREEAVEQLQRHAVLQQTLSVALQELASLPPEPAAPQIPARYQGIAPEEALAKAKQDTQKYAELEAGKKKNQLIWAIFGAISVILLIIGFIIGGSAWLAIGLAIVLGGAAVFGLSYVRIGLLTKQIHALMDHYPGISPRQWVEDAEFYAETWQQYLDTKHHAATLRQNAQAHLEETEAQLDELTQGMESHQFLLSRNRIIADNDALLEARREHQRACAHADALRAMVRPVQPPQMPDELTLSAQETAQQISDSAAELRQLQLRLGQCQGRMDTLGSESSLRAQLEACGHRIANLNQTYRALDLALRTLESATAELQRRFAPRIAQQAQTLFTQLTGGRYDRLTFTQDLSVNAGAAEEIALRSAQWRSEGTVDQLYFALRLAVAKELTPDAPLILDDALVRFDDTRHGLAMDILRQEAEEKQIILFTCQSRER